jgi:two-component system OmpR family sensor kinase
VTLRSRLLVALVAVVATGLLVCATVTYLQLRSFLLNRLDPQLQVASFSVTRAVVATDGLGPSVPFAGNPAYRPPAGPPGSSATPGHFYFGTGSGLFATGSGHTVTGLPRSELIPTGTVGELLRANGTVRGRAVTFTYGGKAAPAPVLPHPLPSTGPTGEVYLTASSQGAGAVSYRVLVRRLGVDDLSVAVAVPLTEVNQTLSRLLWIEILVSTAVLVGLGALSWWLIRRDLRPLEEMAVTAGAIAGGELGLRVTPAEDRTEVGRLGLALNSMLGEIEEAFADRAASEARLRRFLADASHELRTPLTSIRGYAELYELGARERPADLDTAMRHIREEARRMNELVDELMLLAQMGEGRPPAAGPVDMGAVIEASAGAARVTSPEAVVRIECPGPVEVVGDRSRLRQVVDNLLSNALRYAPPGSPVDITVSAEGDQVRVEVRDRGPGVLPEEAERVFEPFYRSDFARSRAAGGAGLGLAIVSAIIRAHGGTTGVRAAEGGGACFWFRLPAAAGAGPRAESPATETIGPEVGIGIEERAGDPRPGPTAQPQDVDSFS